METSASLNSGFNVLEALRFLLQLFLFIHAFFFFVYCIFKCPWLPPRSLLLALSGGSVANGRVWEQRAGSCARSPGVAWETAPLEQRCPLPLPSAFPTASLCVAKTFALTVHSYTLDAFPVLF